MNGYKKGRSTIKHDSSDGDDKTNAITQLYVSDKVTVNILPVS
ncbi:MAG TPA: hypothetical protein VE818_05905 [Nitrososphaeraceae archaeon]|jgi:hypothetical protein|nr:hypothetical protein [Nitrososphaeraceae archaeon]